MPRRLGSTLGINSLEPSWPWTWLTWVAGSVTLMLCTLDSTTSRGATSLAFHLPCSLLLDPKPCDGAPNSCGGFCRASAASWT